MANNLTHAQLQASSDALRLATRNQVLENGVGPNLMTHSLNNTADFLDQIVGRMQPAGQAAITLNVFVGTEANHLSQNIRRLDHTNGPITIESLDLMIASIASLRNPVPPPNNVAVLPPAEIGELLYKAQYELLTARGELDVHCRTFQLGRILPLLAAILVLLFVGMCWIFLHDCRAATSNPPNAPNASNAPNAPNASRNLTAIPAPTPSRPQNQICLVVTSSSVFAVAIFLVSFLLVLVFFGLRHLSSSRDPNRELRYVSYFVISFLLGLAIVLIIPAAYSGAVKRDNILFASWASSGLGVFFALWNFFREENSLRLFHISC